MRRRLLFLTPLVALGFTVSARAQDSDLPTPAAVQKLVDTGQYPAALKALQRILGLNAMLAAGYDHYDMLMLRAECELQIHQQPAALESLTAAKKEAFAQYKPDRAADPIATAFLVRSSRAYQYVPKAVAGGGGGGEGSIRF